MVKLTKLKKQKQSTAKFHRGVGGKFTNVMNAEKYRLLFNSRLLEEDIEDEVDEEDL